MEGRIPLRFPIYPHESGIFSNFENIRDLEMREILLFLRGDSRGRERDDFRVAFCMGK